MDRLLVVCLAALVVALVAGCAGRQTSGAPGAPDALYRQRCSGCHRPYEPASRTRAQWAAAMDRMAPRAHLSPEQEGTLRHWLEAHASDAGVAR
jgi:mono/diheme cytochrome c family protein